MKQIIFSFLVIMVLGACSGESGNQQEETATSQDTTALEQERITQLPVQKDLEEVQERLEVRLTALQTELDSAQVDRQADLQGMIRKLEAREKQLAQHLRKFEMGMSGNAEELEKRFQQLIEDIEADLELTSQQN
jgi:hypothetical protein